MPPSLDAAHSVLKRTGIPKGWIDASVNDLARIIGGGTPDREKSEYWRNGTIPWITPTDLTANASKYIASGSESISELGLENSNATLVPKNSIVFSTRGTVGSMALAAAPLTCNQSCEIIVPRKDAADGEFLYYLLNYGLSAFIRLSGGTTFGAITRRDIARVRFAVPPSVDEQRSIARILDAVDTALEFTRAALELAQELRRGLLQAAFGFVFSMEPKKQSDAGLIPQSWDAIKGKNAFVIVSGGCSSVDALRRLRNGAEPDAWFMKVDDFNLPSNRRKIVHTKIGFRAAENRIFKLHAPGTLVIAKRGVAILKNRVRTTTVPIALDPNLMALQVLPGFRPEFLRCQFEWRNLSRYVESSGVPQLNNKDLYPRFFLRAPDLIQQQIIETIAAAEAYEDSLVAKCEVYDTLKKSLMHDLLTGRVRVNKPAEAAA